MSKRALRCSLFALVFWNAAAFAQPHRAQPHSVESPYIPNRYTLILQDPPVAERFASRESLATAQADTYRRQLDTAQAAVKSQLAARNFQVIGSVSEVLNAVFVLADASRVAELQSIPGVAAVRPVKKMKLLLNRATALVNAPAAWNAVGGQSKAGAGIKIGVLDTGIDQTHPALQDSSLSTPSGFPKFDTQADQAYTTNKVIVARSYVSLLAAGSNPANPAVDSMPDDLTARDRSGHGTFNAVIAAGNTVSTQALATTGGNVSINGMAPKAWLGNYKVQGTDGVNGYSDDQVLIAAVNDAVKDGMDIINCSFGGLASSDAGTDPAATAFENATKSAVVVAAAGDDGADSYNDGYSYPGFNTISSPSNAPDVISVGATLNSHVMLPTVSVNSSSAPSNLKNINSAVGDSFFYPSQVGSNVAPLIDITTLGDNGLACAALPANSLNGAFALIQRGTCTFDTKAANAQNAGAIGFIYYMAASGAPVSPEGINEYGPSVMISQSDGANLKSYVDANPGTTVVVDLNGLEQDLTAYNAQPCVDPTTGPCPAFSPAVAANQFASYSSMGPTPDGQLKPDMVAPGGFDPEQVPDPNGDIFAAAGFFSGTQYFDPTGVMFSSNRYAAAAGTSFSSPMVAGAAALMKQLHPTLTPGQIKSLLVDYANAQATPTDDFADPVDAEMIGAGLLDANAATSANVTAVPSTISFGILNSATLPITKQITLTNISSSSISLNAAVSCCSVNQSPNGTSGNAKVAVSPSSVTLAAGATAALTVTLSGSAPTAGEYSGNVTLSNSSTTMRIPFMMLEGNGTVANVLPLGGAEGVPGEDVGPAMVQVTDAFGIPVANSPVTFSVSPRGTMTLKSVSGEPACTPASSTTSVTCPSDQFGYAYAEAVLGTSVSSPTLNFSASGNTGSFSYNIQAQPTITSASVVDAAVFKQPIVPGSYINIYGTGLSDQTSNPNGDSNDATTDALAANGTYSILPLQIDYVTVSFDVPSAGISVPGHITYVCQGCSGGADVVQLQVPWELQGQSSVQVKVVLDNDLFGNVVSVPLANQSPQFFTNGNNVADALDTSYHLISTSNPAKRGSIIFLYANALGPVNNQPADGAPALDATSTTTNPVTVTIGGQTATASFAGLAPGFPGLYQINVTVPQGATTGSAVPITVTVNGQTSAQSTIPVQ